MSPPHLGQTIVHLFSHYFTSFVPLHCHRLPVTMFPHMSAILHGSPCDPGPTRRFPLIASLSLYVSHPHKTYTAVKKLIHTFPLSRKHPLLLNVVSIRCPPTPTLVCTSNLRAHFPSTPLPNFRHLIPFKSTCANIFLLLCPPRSPLNHRPLLFIITTVIR